MRLLLLPVVVAALAPFASAQSSDSAFQADLGAMKAQVSELKKALPNSCADAKDQLERRFQLEIHGNKTQSVSFVYAGCREEGRNDYLPPYTERSYKSDKGDYVLVIVTNEGEAQSEVLLWSEGAKEWIGRFGSIANAKLASGEWVDSLKVLKTPAELRGVELTMLERFPQLKTCEESFNKNHANDGYLRNPELLLVTEDAAYYVYEDCDICSAIDSCDLKTGRLTTVKTAHMLSCSDVQEYKKGKQIAYSCK